MCKSSSAWRNDWLQDGLVLGAATTIEQLIFAFQGSHCETHDAWRSAADHLLRIAGEFRN